MEKLNKKTLEQFSKLTLDISSLKKDTDNPYFKSKYVELSDILTEVKKKIHEYGFTLLQYVIYESDKSFLQTDFVFQENGEVVSGKIPLVFQNPDMQKLGSAITYARRYALMTMLNIETEDDDGNIASADEMNVKTGYSKKETLPDAEGLIDFLKSHSKPTTFYRDVKTGNYPENIKQQAIDIMYPKVEKW